MQKQWSLIAAMHLQEHEILKAASEWALKWQKELEGSTTEFWKLTLQHLNVCKAVAERYSVKPTPVAAEAEEILKTTMVTVSEALVMRALASDQPSSAVSAQLARMSANKVGAITPQILMDAWAVQIALWYR